MTGPSISPPWLFILLVNRLAHVFSPVYRLCMPPYVLLRNFQVTILTSSFLSLPLFAVS
ncbi:hypothetical protein EDC04DRAFT_2691412 [Pisolithus marmoratus]|nr:hypothetical protein EDC04DRAFT_2691412 [Pisolithus marmoratus]